MTLAAKENNALDRSEGSNVIPFTPRPRPYRTPASTIDAFWYLVDLNEPDRLRAWLLDHPLDQAFLYKLLQDRKNEIR